MFYRVSDTVCCHQACSIESLRGAGITEEDDGSAAKLSSCLANEAENAAKTGM